MASMDKPDRTVLISRPNLPSEEEARMDAIHNYFPDHIIQVDDSPTHFQLHLLRSNYDYCEDLEYGLGWLGVNRDNVRDFFISGQQSFLCLLESWIPYGWSTFLANNNYRETSIAIIHLDDHTDMMSPKIGLYGTEWKDMLTHAAIEMCDPKTVKQAILSGAITLGSMMTPLLHYIEKVDVFHLAHARASANMSIERTTIADDMLDPGLRRMAVLIGDGAPGARREAGRYLRTSKIAEITKAVPTKMDIFLHIDMDYFNNRYNGSTDWRNCSAGCDHPLKQQKEEMSSICESLVRARLVERIRHVSVGISPSFYPVEFWKEAVSFLLHELAASGLPVSDILNHVETLTA